MVTRNTQKVWRNINFRVLECQKLLEWFIIRVVFESSSTHSSISWGSTAIDGAKHITAFYSVILLSERERNSMF